MKTLTLLKKARHLISKEENWTKFAFAKDANGVETASKGNDAICWCSIGAMRKFVGLDFCTDALGELMLAMPEDCRQSVGAFNDSHTHAEVLALFDKAIENTSLK